jgi:mRNA interferase RelE/StbE
VTRAEHEALRERVEDLEDTLLLIAVEGKTKVDDCLPVELVKRMLAGESLVRLWREHRGLGLNELAKAAGIPRSYLSEIENKKKPGSVAALSALAKTLRVAVDDLV